MKKKSAPAPKKENEKSFGTVWRRKLPARISESAPSEIILDARRTAL